MIEKLKWNGSYVDEEGISHDSKEDYLQCGIFDFCGCGDPLKNLIYIRDMLLKVKERKLEYQKDDSYMFFLYWADKEELLEHGGYIGGSWLTEKGEEFLKDMEIIIKEDEEENEL